MICILCKPWNHLTSISAALGLAALTVAVPAAAQDRPDFPIVAKAKTVKSHKPQRRKARRVSRLPTAQCAMPNAACAPANARALQAYASAGPADRATQSARGSASRSCLTPAARALLAQIESRFGAVRIVSTCRRGATIAGTSRPSMHRYGKAIDFVAPPGRKAAVVGWLRDNSPGVTMTYRGMDHIHTDVGPYHKVILTAGSGRRASKRRSRTQHVRKRLPPQQLSAQRWLTQR